MWACVPLPCPQLEAAVSPVVSLLLADDAEVAARVSAVTEAAGIVQATLQAATAASGGTGLGVDRAAAASRFAPGVVHTLSRERHGSDRKSSFRTALARDLQVIEVGCTPPSAPSAYLPTFLSSAGAALVEPRGLSSPGAGGAGVSSGSGSGSGSSSSRAGEDGGQCWACMHYSGLGTLELGLGLRAEGWVWGLDVCAGGPWPYLPSVFSARRARVRAVIAAVFFVFVCIWVADGQRLLGVRRPYPHPRPQPARYPPRVSRRFGLRRFSSMSRWLGVFYMSPVLGC